tara:strand:- start:2575 stop:2730 length:156 start_codon:yes stop_codon:yes gene_type:complete
MAFRESYGKYKNPDNDYEENWNKYCGMRKWELIEELLYYRTQHGYLKGGRK